MTPDIQDELNAWGQDPTPAPDAEFTSRLDADLRSAAYFAPRTTGAIAPGRRVLRPGVVLAAVVLLAGLGLSALARIGDDDTTTPATTPVEVSPTSTPTTAATSTPQAPTAQPSPTPNAPSFDLAPFDASTTAEGALPDDPTSATEQASPDREEPVPTQTPAATPTTDPPEADLPTTPPAAPPVTELTPEPTPADPEPTPTDTDVVPSLTLERSYRANRARLSWAISESGTTLRWEVRVRRGDAVGTAAVLPSRRNDLTVERPQRGRVFYRVVAVGNGGAVVAESNEVRVTSRPGG